LYEKKINKLPPVAFGRDLNIPGIEPDEEFRQIEEAPDYYISNKGRVLSGRYLRILKPVIERGREQVQIYVKEKPVTFYIHRLVAKAFVPGYAKGLTVNHIDGNCRNNTPDNLEWCTIQENLDHAFRTGLAAHLRRPVQIIETGEIFESINATARYLGVDAAVVMDVVEGEVHSVHGFHLKYYVDPIDDSVEILKCNNHYIPDHSKKTFSKPVRIIETGDIFNSIRSCALHLHTYPSSIRESIKHGWAVRGYHLEFFNGDISKVKFQSDDILATYERYSAGVRPIKIIETGECFGSVREASCKKHISTSQIRKSLIRGWATHNLHFEYIQ